MTTPTTGQADLPAPPPPPRQRAPQLQVYKPGLRATDAFGICVYGKGGVGKTTLVGTMPGKGLVVDIPQLEGGTLVLGDQAERIDVVSVATWDEIDNVYWHLKNAKHSYDWVAIDSITAMEELAKRKVIRERDLAADPHTVSQNEYGKVGRLVGELVYQFRTLKVHTIWIAQERFFKEEGVPTMTGPAVIPSALAALMPSMLIVGRLSVEYGLDGSVERQLRISPSPTFYAKVRARPGLDPPRVVRSPSLAVLLKYLLGTGPRPEEVQEGLLFTLPPLVQ